MNRPIPPRILFVCIGDVCPWVPAKQRLDWQIPDPIGKDVVFFRKVREQIQTEVLQLLDKLR